MRQSHSTQKTSPEKNEKTTISRKYQRIQKANSSSHKNTQQSQERERASKNIQMQSQHTHLQEKHGNS